MDDSDKGPIIYLVYGISDIDLTYLISIWSSRNKADQEVKKFEGDIDDENIYNTEYFIEEYVLDSGYQF